GTRSRRPRPCPRRLAPDPCGSSSLRTGLLQWFREREHARCEPLAESTRHVPRCGAAAVLTQQPPSAEGRAGGCTQVLRLMSRTLLVPSGKQLGTIVLT